MTVDPKDQKAHANSRAALIGARIRQRRLVKCRIARLVQGGADNMTDGSVSLSKYRRGGRARAQLL